MSRATLPRHIKPETIHIGDVIRVRTETGDLERSVVGKVASRDHEGAATVYRTQGGEEILRYIRENSRSFVVTLILPAKSREAAIEPLFELT